MHTLTSRTYVNSDSTKVVDEGSPDAAYLLGDAGDEISAETAERLGLNVAVPQTNDYAAMKVPELKELVANRSIDVPSDAKKADLVDALEGADATAKAEEASSSSSSATASEATAATGGTADVANPAEA